MFARSGEPGLGGDVVGCGRAERAIRRGGHVRAGLEHYAGQAVRTDVQPPAGALVERLGRQR
jgi:3-keto-5-aminohexanoate cleavage enzyme